MRAAAVEAVRCGLRWALSRASDPAAPPIRVAGQPRMRASGTTRCDEKSATPTKMSNAPTPIQSRTCVVPRPLPKSP